MMSFAFTIQAQIIQNFERTFETDEGVYGYVIVKTRPVTYGAAFLNIQQEEVVIQGVNNIDNNQMEEQGYIFPLKCQDCFFTVAGQAQFAENRELEGVAWSNVFKGTIPSSQIHRSAGGLGNATPEVIFDQNAKDFHTSELEKRGYSIWEKKGYVIKLSVSDVQGATIVNILSAKREAELLAQKRQEAEQYYQEAYNQYSFAMQSNNIDGLRDAQKTLEKAMRLDPNNPKYEHLSNTIAFAIQEANQQKNSDENVAIGGTIAVGEDSRGRPIDSNGRIIASGYDELGNAVDANGQRIASNVDYVGYPVDANGRRIVNTDGSAFKGPNQVTETYNDRKQIGTDRYGNPVYEDEQTNKQEEQTPEEKVIYEEVPDLTDEKIIAAGAVAGTALVLAAGASDIGMGLFTTTALSSEVNFYLGAEGFFQYEEHQGVSIGYGLGLSEGIDGYMINLGYFYRFCNYCDNQSFALGLELQFEEYVYEHGERNIGNSTYINRFSEGSITRLGFNAHFSFARIGLAFPIDALIIDNFYGDQSEDAGLSLNVGTMFWF